MRLLLLGLVACSSTTSVDAGVDASGIADADDANPADARFVDVGPADSAADVTADARATPDVRETCPEWCPSENLPEPLQEISVTGFGDGFVVLGGFDGDGNIETSVHWYKPGEGFSALPRLPDGRHHAGVLVHEGDLYVFGGMRDARFTPLSRCLVLREGESEWDDIAPLPSTRAAGVAASVDGVIVYVAGQGEGRSNDERLDAARPVYIYDPEGDSWREAAPMPTARDHAAAFVFGGELYVLGGRRLRLDPTLDTMEIYSVERDEWRTGPTMPQPRGGHAAVLAGGLAYVSGGEERGRALNSVDVFDVAAGTWAAGPEMLSPRHGHGMASLGGQVYAVGGADMPVFAAVDTMEVLSPTR